MMTESNFKEDAVSYKGAIGLMQLMPDTANWLKDKLHLPYHTKDPTINIQLGIMYLQMMERRFGNRDKAIVAYNRGPKRTQREVDKGIVKTEYLNEVKKYLEKVT